MANTFKSIPYKNVGSVAVSVYTAPGATQVTVIGSTIANTSSSPIEIDVFLRRSAVDYYVLKGTLVASGSAEVPFGGDQKLVLQAGDQLFVKSNATDSADVILSVLEIA